MEASSVRPHVQHLEGLPEDGWNDDRGNLTFRTVFSADRTPSSLLTTGIADIPMGGFLALHRHEQSETYFVLSGEGTVTLEGETYALRANTSVFIPGNAEHGIRNNGTAPLRIHYALAVDRFSEVEYRFS